MDQQNETVKKEEAKYELEKDITIKVLWFYQHKKREDKTEPIEEDENPDEEELVDILFSTESNNKLILHWGCFKPTSPSGWCHLPKEAYPPETKEFDKNALQTEFKNKEIQMLIPRGKGYSSAIGGINFVFFDPEHNKWYNNYRKDYQIKFKLKINRRKSKQILVDNNLYVPEFVTDVIDCEANYGSWTLMHRYNKCYDIIESLITWINY